MSACRGAFRTAFRGGIRITISLKYFFQLHTLFLPASMIFPFYNLQITILILNLLQALHPYHFIEDRNYFKINGRWPYKDSKFLACIPWVAIYNKQSNFTRLLLIAILQIEKSTVPGVSIRLRIYFLLSWKYSIWIAWLLMVILSLFQIHIIENLSLIFPFSYCICFFQVPVCQCILPWSIWR